ncbi:HesA/MoeB/ThiF family protein [Tabrizicola sp.]|uniref:HesA/MoeB/ThiF family protein n=1 Tax=Tabrizicola sp. TaxID=2005166 RepID=UPI00286B3702|nr:HesA/MoeB/ThiF family protein [Tabrizicola sp.]
MIGLLGFAAIWGAARWFRWRWPWAALWAWWAAIMIIHAPLQVDNPLRAVVGGDFRGWLVFGLLAAVVSIYRLVFKALRGRAVVAPVAEAGPFRAAELDRYARHILLREIGGPGQKRLKAARVLVVGAGGLGSPAMLYLAASGVGVIGVIDPDEVENSNLQRQIIHTDQRIGMPKVFSAEIAMKALNPFIEVRPYHRALDEATAAALIADYDLVLDGTDNFDTRYLVNRVCAALGKPLISGAITQWEGQLSLFDTAKGTPCYACIFPTRPAPGLVPTCAEAGVAAPLPGIIGAMMAMEAVKHITGAGETLAGRLLIHDALFGETRVIVAKRRDDCPVCGAAR